MRLIDADALKEQCRMIPDVTGKYYCLNIVEEYEINDAPTVCDIEQIRDEIERLHYHPKLDFIKNDEVVDMALNIIDKHMKGDETNGQEAVDRGRG